MDAGANAPVSLLPEDEFAGIRSRAGRHPALALGAAALALFIIFHVRADIGYSLSSIEPVDLGDAAATFGPTKPDGAAPAPASTSAGAAGRPVGVSPDTLARAANRYVRVRGTPDRESALELDTKGSWVFTQFFRILGTGSRLFVHRRENPLPGFRAEEDAFEGRLIRFSDLSFEASIRNYSATHVSATHFFAPTVLSQAVATSSGAATTVMDLAGDPVALGPNDLLAIDLVLPERIRIAFPRDKFRDETAARAEVEKRGGQVITAAESPPPSPSSSASASATHMPPADDRVVLVVRFPPERRQGALGELGDLDPKIEIRDARRTFTVRLADLRDDGDALLVQSTEAGAARERLPLGDIPAIRTLAAVQIPTDAWLLIESDHPRDHVQTVIFAGVLLAFAVINLAGLARGLRRS